jgi:hypothetical protein
VEEAVAEIVIAEQEDVIMMAPEDEVAVHEEVKEEVANVQEEVKDDGSRIIGQFKDYLVVAR